LIETPFAKALNIDPRERDHALDLTNPQWPAPGSIPTGWTEGSDCLQRIITPESSGAGAADKHLATPLKESILRFPSAPMHGVHRLHEYHNNLPVSQSVHTYRVLTAPKPDREIKRIFLFHNGLNELNRMSLYYQLAAHLIQDDRAVACILRPFPGHLSRAPFADFPENPLHRYLWDGSHLFRQFLRFMVETQWFLSALVKRSRYRSLAGTVLLAEDDEHEHSRLQPGVLAEAMLTSWTQLHVASEDALEHQEPKPRDREIQKPNKTVFQSAVESLRRVLNLNAYDDLDGGTACSDVEPSFHVIGYSLGGFAAQSVFMSWPFLIRSCSTLLSGGALRELSPTAFASPEEWQTVLHSLRYELDDGMLGGRYGADKNKPAGLDRDLFLYFQRTFYEVFQQEYRGSFRSRLAAFRQRMLFVVGGDDPIVRPQSVLDSAPPGGINLLEIGGLGHFLGASPKGTEEKQQRAFWLPEIGRLIDRFSVEATKRHSAEQTSLNHKLEAIDPESYVNADEIVEGLGERDILHLTESGALPSKLFELALKEMLTQHQGAAGGLLIIARNEIPTLLLDAKAVQRRGRAIYHEDLSIIRYCHGINERWKLLRNSLERTRLILPWNADRICMHLDAEHGFPSQAETGVGHIPDEMSPESVWEAFERTCSEINSSAPGSIVIFDGQAALESRPDDMEARARKLIESQQAIVPDNLLWVPSLPDCWVWVSPDFLKDALGCTASAVAPTATESFFAAVERLRVNNDATKTELLGYLDKGDLRIITVSRARYNPRFRGQLVRDVGAVKHILLHVALCLAASYPYDPSRFGLEHR
jgi:hypothetical protein